MKYAIGVFVTALILFVATYFLLKIWGINMLDAEDFSRILYTIAIVIVTAFVLVVFILIPVFKKPDAGYNKNGDGIAQKKV